MREIMKMFRSQFRNISLAVLLYPISAYCAPLLMREPTISKTQVVFVYADQLWSVARSGGKAHLLTSGQGIKSNPVFSPDGSLIAFTGQYDGNEDVYVMPAEGGLPSRLTHHPAPDEVVGWAPDGEHVLFRSHRKSYAYFDRLFEVSLRGGLPLELPLPMARFGSFSPDGKRLAYVPVDNDDQGLAWKRYRGGKASAIWLVDWSDLSIEKLPHELANDSHPMWIGDKIYYLSDRDGANTLFAYNVASKKATRVLDSDGTDIQSASPGPGAIVFDKLGSLNVFDLATQTATAISVTVDAELPNTRARFRPARDEITVGSLSPSGASAVFEAHGEIFTVPAQKGDIRDLTNTPGATERSPAWSPDGKSVAYFSDESGEYQLFIQGADGMHPPRKISLSASPSFYYDPVWSPDSKKIAYTDNQLNIWYVDLDKGAPVKVDTDEYTSPERSLNPAWSPDGRWIAYARMLASNFHSIFAYSIEKKTSVRLTDGLSDARFPVFDPSGKYLYFTASTDIGPAAAWLQLSSLNRPVTRSLYLMVLRSGQPSPLAPENSEEGQQAKADAASAQPEKRAKEPVEIDPEGIDQRIVVLPVPARNYTELAAGSAGPVFMLEASALPSQDQSASVWRFDLISRKTEKLLDGVNDVSISDDGSKLLYSRADKKKKWYVAPGSGSGDEVSKQETELNLDQMELLVDPRAEWREEFKEVWRMERDFFYDPNLHGVQLERAKKQYEPFLDGLGSRTDFRALLVDMLGEFSVGHMFASSPSEEHVEQGKVGLLGADYRVENGRYRFAKIYQAESWTPELRAPLTQPGVQVHVGDYLLAVNGAELRGTDEIFQLFEGLAGKSATLRVSPSPDGRNARDVTVVTVDNEIPLRNHAWIDENRRKVDELSGGRLAYIYLPDTDQGGYAAFNRYYYAQAGREGAVIDERFNGGGEAADYVIDLLQRPLQNYWLTRNTKIMASPAGAIFGPKVLITNMYAGSGGDLLPWYFRKDKVGPIVGTRTWGGLVGIYDPPLLMDGGFVTSPSIAFFTAEGKWEVENHGVAPDYEVDITPRSSNSGHDPQLEKAVQLVVSGLPRKPSQPISPPPFPNYHSDGERPH